MGKVRFQIAVSLDGYMAGPEQSEANPLGIGGWISINGCSTSRPGARAWARKAAR